MNRDPDRFLNRDPLSGGRPLPLDDDELDAILATCRDELDDRLAQTIDTSAAWKRLRAGRVPWPVGALARLEDFFSSTWRWIVGFLASVGVLWALIDLYMLRGIGTVLITGAPALAYLLLAFAASPTGACERLRGARLRRGDARSGNLAHRARDHWAGRLETAQFLSARRGQALVQLCSFEGRLGDASPAGAYLGDSQERLISHVNGTSEQTAPLLVRYRGNRVVFVVDIVGWGEQRHGEYDLRALITRSTRAFMEQALEDAGLSPDDYAIEVSGNSFIAYLSEPSATSQDVSGAVAVLLTALVGRRGGFGAELEHLRAERGRLVDRIVEMTRGDSADPAEAVECAAELERVDHRIDELLGLLSTSTNTGLSEPRSSGEEVDVGALVTLEFDDGHTSTVQVDGLLSPDTAVLSSDSPLGRAILGRRAGDTVTYTTQQGTEDAKILSVRATDQYGRPAWQAPRIGQQNLAVHAHANIYCQVTVDALLNRAKEDRS